MNLIIKYIVVSSNAVGNVEEFEFSVMEKLKEGFKLVGGVSTSFSGRLMQAMKKEIFEKTNDIN